MKKFNLRNQQQEHRLKKSRNMHLTKLYNQTNVLFLKINVCMSPIIKLDVKWLFGQTTLRISNLA